MRGRRLVGRGHGGQVELLARLALDLRAVDEAVAAHPDVVVGLRQIGDDVAALVVGDDDADEAHAAGRAFPRSPRRRLRGPSAPRTTPPMSSLSMATAAAAGAWASAGDHWCGGDAARRPRPSMPTRQVSVSVLMVRSSCRSQSAPSSSFAIDVCMARGARDYAQSASRIQPYSAVDHSANNRVRQQVAVRRSCAVAACRARVAGRPRRAARAPARCSSPTKICGSDGVNFSFASQPAISALAPPRTLPCSDVVCAQRVVEQRVAEERPVVLVVAAERGAVGARRRHAPASWGAAARE